MEKHKRVAWDQNTNMDPKNEPNFYFSSFTF